MHITVRQIQQSLGSMLLVATLVGCEARGEKDAQAAPPLPEVDVARVQAEDVVLWNAFSGRVEAPQTVELRPRISGYIERVAFSEGSLVEEGDVLLEIDKRPYAARVRLAEAELASVQSRLELATSEMQRAENLWKRQAISREEFEQRNSALMAARAAVDAASANIENAQLELEHTQIRAPITGRIGRAEVTRGNLAMADMTVLANIVSVDPLYVYFESDEATARINPLDTEAKVPVRIRVDAQGQEYITGHLDFIDNRYDSHTGTLQYRAVIANPDNRFKPGQFARVEMPVDRASRAILLDQKAVLTDQDRRYVYVLDADDKASRRFVEVGRRFDGLVVVGEGLQDGERVVVNGLKKIIFPGMQVAPHLVAMRPDQILSAQIDK